MRNAFRFCPARKPAYREVPSFRLLSPRSPRTSQARGQPRWLVGPTSVGRVWRSLRAFRQLIRGRNSDSSTLSRYLVAMLRSESSTTSDSMCGSQPEVDQLGVLRVVVVLFLLDARIRQVVDRDFETEVGRGALNEAGELEDRELLGELVVDPALARIGRVQAGQLDAADGIADVDVAARLAALPVHRQRMLHGRFDAEPVQDRAEHLVVVEPVDQRLVERRPRRSACRRRRPDSGRWRAGPRSGRRT